MDDKAIMKHKRKGGFSELIMELLMIVPNLFDMVQDVVTHARNKARLVKKGLFFITAFSFMIATLLTSLWFSSLAMLVVYLNSLHVRLDITVLMILIMNMILIMSIIGIICKHKKNLLFNSTRSQCKRLSTCDWLK